MNVNLISFTLLKFITWSFESFHVNNKNVIVHRVRDTRGKQGRSKCLLCSVTRVFKVANPSYHCNCSMTTTRSSHCQSVKTALPIPAVPCTWKCTKPQPRGSHCLASLTSQCQTASKSSRTCRQMYRVYKDRFKQMETDRTQYIPVIFVSKDVVSFAQVWISRWQLRRTGDSVWARWFFSCVPYVLTLSWVCVLQVPLSEAVVCDLSRSSVLFVRVSMTRRLSCDIIRIQDESKYSCLLVCVWRCTKCSLMFSHSWVLVLKSPPWSDWRILYYPY
jgi:hypothetical protein